MSTPAEKANLARIRDNQRRSRARRKEYLQDLEHKLRLCELQGIEASHEMQIAARKVAEENKKLRSLLNRHGVNDDGIEAYIQTGIVVPPGDPSIPQYRSGATGDAVQALEQLLTPRRPSCLDPNIPFCAPSSSTAGSHAAGAGGGGRTSREGSLTSVSTSNTMWDTTMSTAPSTQQSRTLPSSNSQVNKMASPQSFISPTHSSSSVNRTEAAIALSGLGSVMEPPPQRGSNVNVSPGTGPQDSQATQAYNFEVQMQLHNPSSYSTAQHHHKNSSSSQSCGPSSSSLYAATSVAQSHTGHGSNCCMATDLISSMTGADPQSVRSSLGCVPGMDCQVDNTTFNNAIERYTATTIGM